MGLNASQQESAKVLLNNNQTLSYINQKHGGENVVANKIKALIDSGFNKQQAMSILALSPSNNPDAMLKEIDQSKILKVLGFDKEQIKNLVNMNKESKYPLQKQLLNKMGLDNDTAKILQALTNKESLKSQEIMIKSSTPEAIWFLDKTIEKFEALKKPAFKQEGFNFNLAVLLASLAELGRILVKGRASSRNARFGMGIAAVKQKRIQADKIKEAAMQELQGALIANAATIISSFVQVRMISTAPPATVNAVSIKAQAIGSSITASGGIGKAVMDYEAGQTKAEQKESEAVELLYNTYLNEIGEFINNKTADLNKTQSTISEIEKSNANINRTLAG